MVIYWLYTGQKELVVYWLDTYVAYFRSKTPGIPFASLGKSNIYHDEARLVVYWSPIIVQTEIEILVMYWSCLILANDPTNFLRAVMQDLQKSLASIYVLIEVLHLLSQFPPNISTSVFNLLSMA